MVRVAQVLAALALLSSNAAAEAAGSIATQLQLCASCHGRAGVPADHTVPIIWGQQAGYIRKQLDDYRNGDRDSQIMSSIAESLSNHQVAQIAGYFGNAKWPVQSTPPPPPAPPAPAAIAACRACHGANLTGGPSPSGVAPRLAAQFSAYLSDTMTAYADGERANSATMSALMQSLSPADRKTVADYLAALR